MQSATHPIIKDLVLIGGGHTHAIALRMFGMKPLPGLRLTLITDVSHTPYSGMLPGHVAGYYDFDECHIDLRRLAQASSAQIYIDQAVGLDLENKKVLCANHPPVAFDVLSIDIGSTPAKVNVPGAAEYTIPAKPVPLFLKHWNQIIEEVAKNPQKPISLGIVGGGAGGVELAMTMQQHLIQVLSAKEHIRPLAKVEITPLNPPLIRGEKLEILPPPLSKRRAGDGSFMDFCKRSIQEVPLKIHLFQRGSELMPNHSYGVRRHLYNLLLSRGIQVHLQETVSEVLPDKICCESGLKVECDYTFWVTNASAPDWIEKSGLKTDSDGFILVSDTLQSISHPHIFAAGDIATMVNHPRPKAGVFAVRQGKPLFENLRAFLLGKPLKDYQPQKLYLSLIGTGKGEAIASWGPLCWQSPLLWRWKDYIDRKFMKRFSDLKMGKGDAGTRGRGDAENALANLSNLSSSSQSKIQNPMRCAGCGSKVGSSTLERVLQRLQLQTHHWVERDDVIVGLGEPDDAAVMQVPAGQVMVQTIDYFRSLISDPYIFGQISTNHCLSDIFAMGATPQSALAVVSIPYASEEQVEETLYQLLSGAMKVLSQSRTQLVGGHTTQGAELAFGLTCNGLAAPDKLLRKSGMKPNQVLILTKALGTGTLFAADMQLEAKGRWIDNAVYSMLLSNQEAAQVFLQHGATACTDITGFGLLGHLIEMIKASNVAVELDLEAIPILEGALETVKKGIMSSLHSQNLRASYYINNVAEVNTSPKYPLLFDPQTSGGLLASVPLEQANSCLAALQAKGYAHSKIVGRVFTAPNGVMPVTIATLSD